MSDGPRPVRGRIARRIGRPQDPVISKYARACPRCGTALSRYNDGPLCNPCDARHGTARMPRIRGRTNVEGD